MRNLPNIEPSGFTRGAYVGYGGGRVWLIQKTNSSYGNWTASPRVIAENDRLYPTLYAFRLADMSAQLEALSTS